MHTYSPGLNALPLVCSHTLSSWLPLPLLQSYLILNKITLNHAILWSLVWPIFVVFDLLLVTANFLGNWVLIYFTYVRQIWTNQLNFTCSSWWVNFHWLKRIPWFMQLMWKRDLVWRVVFFLLMLFNYI